MNPEEQEKLYQDVAHKMREHLKRHKFEFNSWGRRAGKTDFQARARAYQHPRIGVIDMVKDSSGGYVANLRQFTGRP